MAIFTIREVSVNYDDQYFFDYCYDSVTKKLKDSYGDDHMEAAIMRGMTSAFLFAVKVLLKNEVVTNFDKFVRFRAIARYLDGVGTIEPMTREAKRKILKNTRYKRPVLDQFTSYTTACMYEITNGFDPVIVNNIYMKYHRITDEDIDLILSDLDRVYDNDIHEAYYRQLQQFFPNYFMAMRSIGIKERDIQKYHKNDDVFTEIYQLVKEQKLMEVNQAQYAKASFDRSSGQFLIRTNSKVRSEPVKKASNNLRDIILGEIPAPEIMVESDTGSVDVKLE